MKQKTDISMIAKNRRAFHDYEILSRYEAGLVLTGSEVRSLRDNNCQLKDAYALIHKGEAWLHNLHISPFRHGGWSNADPDRKRKLLLHKREIRILAQKTQEKGLALVPLSMYFSKNSLVKVELGLARGKKLHDKRRTIAEKDAKRDIERALKERSR